MINKNTPILIIGFGSIGKRHYKNLLSLGYAAVSIFDTNPDSFKKLQKITKVTKISKSTLLNFKAVFICTPAHMHVFYARMALMSGCAVFIEKPLSVSLKGTSALVSLAKRKKITAMVACNFRFSKVYSKMVEVLHSGKYGKPVLANVSVGYYLPSARTHANFRKNYAAELKYGGGVILDSGGHVIEYLMSLFGEAKKSVSLKTSGDALRIKSEDAAGIILKHTTGVVSIVALDFLSRKAVHTIQLVTEKGTFHLDFKADTLRFETDVKSILLYKGKKDENEMFLEEIKHFLKYAETRKPFQNLENAKKVLETLVGLKKFS